MDRVDMGDAERTRMALPHIVVLDTEGAILDVVRALLQESGQYNVTTTNFVDRTFDVLEVLQPSVVVLDLAFGEAAGWELLERLAGAVTTRGVPVLLTSTDQRLLARAASLPERYGDRRALVKPYDVEELLGTITELVHQG